jgi:hypothetical protein
MRTDSQGRRLCSSTAKSTGKPCRAPAVAGATVCRLHGAAKGTPARDKADHLVLSQLVGPALARLKQLVESADTHDAVVLGAIREILSRSGYQETYLMTFEEVLPHIVRLKAELEANRVAKEIARDRLA